MVMKKVFLLTGILLWTGFFYSGNSQPCSIGSPGVKLNYAVTDGSNCRINIDLYFDMDHNSGGKFAWVHIWPTADYSNWGYGSPPTMANGGLTGSIASFGFEHKGGDLFIQSSYPLDPSAPGFQYTGLSVSEGPGEVTGFERYTVKNLSLLLPGGCNIPRSFTADVWQSQAAGSNVVHCFDKGLAFFANDPSVTGFMNCFVPRTYSFQVTTISAADMTVNYKVFIDDGDGIFNKPTDNIEVAGGIALLNAGNNYHYNSGLRGYLPYSGQKPYADRDLWVELTTAAVPNAVYAHLINSCIALPVQMLSFTAARKEKLVDLEWTTAAEINNKGFYIERRSGNEDWARLMFVPSAAPGGNSNSQLFYSYHDPNELTAVSLYRLCQVDLDNRVSYSDTRLVRGVGQVGKLLVYPNPSPDGRLVIVLDEMDRENTIRLLDMNGRVVREWNNLPDGRITVMNLSSGMYIIKVWNKNNNQVEQVKAVISR